MAGGAWPTGCSIYGKGVWFYFCDVHIWAKGGVSWGKHVYGWQKQGVAARLPYMGKGAWLGEGGVAWPVVSPYMGIGVWPEI